MNDDELLTLAAKAAEIKAQYSDNYGDFSIGEPYSRDEARWNPLKFDGDAFRLMTLLRIRLMYPDFEACGDSVLAMANETKHVAEQPLTAEGYRRVIVLLAAKLGEEKGS